jgi:7,8-dihydropterin-6-yl-methyl-4-(beta-D-ribofuranosyl)aminobenzene 5'-phosphate synthase
MLNLTVLVENKTYIDGLMAEHGLSLYLETDQMNLLYDTGASDLFLRNAKRLKVDIDRVEALVISHGHYDHTGGVPSFYQANTHAPIYIHKEAFYESYGLENGKQRNRPCGIRWSLSEIDPNEERVILTEGPKWLTEDIVISGSIPVVEGFVPADHFVIKEPGKEFYPDPMAHEQFLAFRDRDAGGIHVISGCSHTGIESCLRYAKELFPNERVITLVGGFHLSRASAEIREQALLYLLGENIEQIVPFIALG